MFTMGPALRGTVGVSSAQVFKSNLFTGNGGTSRGLTAPGLAGGGVVWVKGDGQSPDIYASPNGSTIYRIAVGSSPAVQSGDMTMSSSGFTLTSSRNNVNLRSYIAWSFAKASRVCDVVAYTGDGAASKALNHALGIAPGLIYVIDRTGADIALYFYNRVSGAGVRGNITTTGAGISDSTTWANTSPSSSQFFVGYDVGHPYSNVSGRDYLAILFAHDTASDGAIQVPGYVGNGSTTGPIVTLGWQPQFVLFNGLTSGANAAAADTARSAGFSGSDQRAYVFLSNAWESGWGDAVSLTADGFQTKSISLDCNGNAANYFALCVRA